MYSPASIAAFTQTVGWDQPQQPTGIILSASNVESTTGRRFAAFHPLCTPYNVEMCMPESTTAVPSAPTLDVLNAKLNDLKTQAALTVLTRVFDQNPLAQYRDNYNGVRIDLSTVNYDLVIAAKPSLFVEAYGCQVAYDALTMMLTSTRSTAVERMVVDKGRISAEIDGYTDGAGKRRTIGVSPRLARAYDALIAALFPTTRRGAYILDASNRV